MPVRLMQAHPKAEQLRNQLAIFRGPILYCLESSDLPGDADLNNIYIPSDIKLKPTTATDLPFGIQDPYRELTPPSFEPIELCLIPYFAWGNRGSSTMSVWLPVVLRT
jgi:DUF1680 family protein